MYLREHLLLNIALSARSAPHVFFGARFSSFHDCAFARKS